MKIYMVQEGTLSPRAVTAPTALLAARCHARSFGGRSVTVRRIGGDLYQVVGFRATALMFTVRPAEADDLIDNDSECHHPPSDEYAHATRLGREVGRYIEKQFYDRIMSSHYEFKGMPQVRVSPLSTGKSESVIHGLNGPLPVPLETAVPAPEPKPTLLDRFFGWWHRLVAYLHRHFG